MKSTTSFFLFFLPVILSAQNTIVITSVPESTPEEASLYLAGSINDWDPGNEAWTFSIQGDDFVLELPQGTQDVFEGKISRGSWATVEGNASGGYLPNRTFDFTNTDLIEIEILSWEDLDNEAEWPDNLYLVDEAFFMPELNRERRIRILLPSDYFDSQNYYPTLYMHDGQNLFVGSESFAGEWEVDEAMLQFESEGYGGAIIVALDNGQQYRIDEYTPWAHPEYGGGEGAEYVDFIVSTLKPFIDENYRSLPEREFTGIMGSSLGGLISHYAGIKYQSIFSKVGIFSPSYWFTNDIYEYTELIGKEENMKFYMLAGGNESEGLEAQIENMIAVLEDGGFNPETEINYQFDPDGQHSEWFWAEYFPEAFEWLFIDNQLSTENESRYRSLVVYPNPSVDELNFLSDDEILSVVVLDQTGRRILSKSDSEITSLDLTGLDRGLYMVNVCFEDGCVTKKVFKL